MLTSEKKYWKTQVRAQTGRRGKQFISQLLDAQHPNKDRTKRSESQKYAGESTDKCADTQLTECAWTKRQMSKHDARKHASRQTAGPIAKKRQLGGQTDRQTEDRLIDGWTER